MEVGQNNGGSLCDRVRQEINGRPIHLGAPSGRAIGRWFVRPFPDWFALFTSCAIPRRGGARDKRRHYCKGLHLAGRGVVRGVRDRGL